MNNGIVSEVGHAWRLGLLGLCSYTKKKFVSAVLSCVNFSY